VERRPARRYPRLALDCIDTYAERMIPLHPQAAESLQPVIELARQQNARTRFDPSAGRPVQHAFLVSGKLLSNALPVLTCPSKPPAPQPA